MSQYTGDKVNMSTLHLLNNKDKLVVKVMNEWGSLHPMKDEKDTDARSPPNYYGLLTVSLFVFRMIFPKNVPKSHQGYDFRAAN